MGEGEVAVGEWRTVNFARIPTGRGAPQTRPPWRPFDALQNERRWSTRELPERMILSHRRSVCFHSGSVPIFLEGFPWPTIGRISANGPPTHRAWESRRADYGHPPWQPPNGCSPGTLGIVRFFGYGGSSGWRSEVGSGAGLNHSSTGEFTVVTHQPNDQSVTGRDTSVD